MFPSSLTTVEEIITSLDHTFSLGGGGGLGGGPNQKTSIFVLRKKGSKTKERMKEDEIEKGDCGPPTRSLFFLRYCRT